MISFLKYPDVGLFLRSGHANYSMLYAETDEMFGVRHPHHVQMSFHNSLFRHWGYCTKPGSGTPSVYTALLAVCMPSAVTEVS